MFLGMIHTTAEEADTDAAFLERAVKGDREAFSALVEKYQSFIYNTAYSIVGNREDADDISQETFLKAYRSLSSFRRESKFSSWLYRICMNTARDYMRAAARHPQTTMPTWGDDNDTEIDLQAPPEETVPEEILERAELRTVVRRAIASLSDDHRQIIVLRDISGYSYEEIADLLQLSIGTVKSRISRARAAVRDILIRGNFLPDETSNTQDERK